MKKEFLLQQDFSDCGPVCLQNILKGYKIDMPLELLREMSGTGSEGSSLLGLLQAAEELGFEAMGAKAEDPGNLAGIEHPCILHLTVDQAYYHYVIFYPPAPGKQQQDRFLIGDPAAGLQQWTKQQLEKMWESKTLLTLRPTDKLLARAASQRSRWSWLRTLVQKDLDLLYLAAFLGLIIAALNLSTAVFSQKLVDSILPKHQTSRLFAGAALLAVLLFARCAISWLRNSLLIRQSYQFNLHLTTHFFESLLYLPKTFFDSRKTGDLTSRLNDVTRIQQAVSYIVGEISVQVLFLLVSLISIFLYSRLAGLLCLLLIPVQFLVVRFHSKHLLEGYRATMRANAAKESNYIDTIRGVGTIRMLNKEPLFIERGKDKMAHFQQALSNLGHRRIRFGFSGEVVGSFFTLAILLACATAVLDGKLRTGEWIAVIQLSLALLQAVAAVAMTNLQLQEAKVAFERIIEFNSIKPERPVQTPAHVPVADRFESLQIRDLCFRFRGRRQLLSNISFEVNKGEIILIIGESGQGKSTLFQILQKMYKPENGKVSINGQNWDQWDLVRWRTLLGTVPQDITIFGGTVLENISFEPAEDPAVIKTFCKQYGFDPCFSRFRQGYTTLLGEGGVRPSGGEKQLLALARCQIGRAHV